jgi:hypothetical protein
MTDHEQVALIKLVEEACCPSESFQSPASMPAFRSFVLAMGDMSSRGSPGATIDRLLWVNTDKINQMTPNALSAGYVG